MVALLYGWQRKAALLPFTVLFIGWVVFSIGFIWSLVDRFKDEVSSPPLFPFYVVLVGGPFVYLLGVAQAISPGIVSSIIGIPTVFVSSVFLVSAGYLTYLGVLYIISHIKREIPADAIKLLLSFIGAMLISISWCFVSMLSVAYKTRPRNSTYQPLTPPEQRPSRKCPFTPGPARVLSIPFIVLSAIGWCVAMVGFIQINYHNVILGGYASRFAEYGLFINGPLLFLAALLHAGCSGGASIVMGVFASILSFLYMVLMGFSVTVFGRDMYIMCEEFQSSDCSILHSSLEINLILAFSGGVASLFFWTFVLLLWPFYRHHPHNSHGNWAAINEHPPDYGATRLDDSYSNTIGNSNGDGAIVTSYSQQ